ncbi:hypothetical protein [Chryseolinea lacunae]|uniref:DUF5723 domain-containing protein n=1 Tax=Chryseolinea lacunae TaxID=2801331 RepID=A0ABS1KK94_9BACT|nr:hypothetical protein [Chryseolinea lacunae]MBL0739662.1 hypothetical protein [Chryseolinea lacunae]
MDFCIPHVWRKFLPVAALTMLAGVVDMSAQNLETIGKAKPLSMSGGISLNQIFYAAQNIDNRRDPYSYFVSGNVNFSLYGWNVPLSFTVSNQNTTFQQPFNQYSLHPTYKWITAHAGYISSSYSPYTVNGHIFLGGAVDLAPAGSWKFSALYGRFLKAVEQDTARVNTSSPAFKRMGYGFKTGYDKNGNSIELILFHAQDQVNSIQSLPDSLVIFPQENLVISLGAGKTFFENFLLKAELSSSAITRDVRADREDNGNALAHAGFLFSPRTSSAYYKAFKSSFDYRHDGFTVGFAYERIDPGYRTLGAYFFNNDLENITANGTVDLLEGKLTVAASAGTQHDNLDQEKISTMRRLVGSLNMNYTPTEKLNLSLSYSNFQTYTNIRSTFVNINQLTPYDNLDTLNYTQIAQNASANCLYTLGGPKERRRSINLNITFQNAADKQGGNNRGGSQFYNFNSGYSLGLVPKNLTFSFMLNGNINRSPALNTFTVGPTASVSKMLMEKKLRIMVSSSYNTAYSNGEHNASLLNGRVSGTYTVKKKHNLNLSMAMINRASQAATSAKTFTEFTGTLGYSYAFAIN